MKKYFTLYPTTHFLYSKTRGCLYNTLNGEIISLNQQQKKLLVLSENGNDLKELNQDELDFYTELENKMLGSYGDKPVVIEPTFLGENLFFNKVSGNKRNFEVLQIALSSECNFNCVFCDKFSNLVYRKTGCKRWTSNGTNERMTDKGWEKYIKEAFQLGCKKIQFFGGEPLLQWNLLKRLISISFDIGIQEIEIYTNGSLLSKEKLNFIKKRKIKLIVQISNMKNNKGILGIAQNIDYERILKLLTDTHVVFEILFIVSKYNEEKIEKYIEIIRDYQCRYRLDFINPFPENIHYSKKYAKFVFDYKRKLIKMNPVNIGILMLKNPCYSKAICISEERVVYPCVMSRLTSYGKLNEKNHLTEILNEKYEELVNLNKGKMQSCKQCVYRWGCISCSAIEISASNGIHSCKNCSLIQEGKNE